MGEDYILFHRTRELSFWFKGELGHDLEEEKGEEREKKGRRKKKKRTRKRRAKKESFEALRLGKS